MGFCLNRLCGAWQAGKASGSLSFLRWRRGAGRNPRSLPNQFTGGVVNGVTDLLAGFIVGVNDLVPDDIVRPELGFLGEFPSVVILI
jgi:hypothetical protein